MRSIRTVVLWAACLSMSLAALGCGGAESAGDSPDAMIQAMARLMTEADAAGVWEALPPSYRRDVNEIVHQAASKMDVEIWKSGTGVARKAVRVLEEKKDFILAHPMMAMAAQNPMVEMEKMSANWDSVTAALRTTLDSEIFRLDDLKQLDVGDFAAKAGARVTKAWLDVAKKVGGESFDEWMSKARSLETTVVTRSGDVATVRIEAEGEEPEDVVVVRVDGRWIPKSLADEWSDRVAEMRGEIAGVTAIEPERKTQVLMVLGGVNATLDQLLSATSQEDFDDAIAGVLGMLGPMMEGE
jgi:hypothetical protein